MGVELLHHLKIRLTKAVGNMNSSAFLETKGLTRELKGIDWEKRDFSSGGESIPFDRDLLEALTF